jgi:zinc D-Ala-D-Ala dipeptidase
MQKYYRRLSFCLTFLILFASSGLRGHDLVSLPSVNSRILIDMRYAGCNNHFGHPIYPFAGCFVVAEVAEQLSKVQKLLERQGYGLKVFDAYRPYHLFTCVGHADFGPAINELYLLEDTCGHSRGTSVDVALICADGGQLDMGSDFGSTGANAACHCGSLRANVYHNRSLLERAMTRYGFVSTPGNWWHYDYGSCSLYPLLDVSFWEIN